MNSVPKSYVPTEEIRKARALSNRRKLWTLIAPTDDMGGTCRFYVVELLSEEDLDSAINDALEADEFRLHAQLILYKLGKYLGNSPPPLLVDDPVNSYPVRKPTRLDRPVTADCIRPNTR